MTETTMHDNVFMRSTLNLFSQIKAAVTTRQVAEHYGLKVNRKGMTCCPFHDDKNPSMKVDERYYCFSCHQTGDVINFTAGLFHTGPYEAAQRLAADFHINISWNDQPKRKKEKKPFARSSQTWPDYLPGWNPSRQKRPGRSARPGSSKRGMCWRNTGCCSTGRWRNIRQRTRTRTSIHALWRPALKMQSWMICSA